MSRAWILVIAAALFVGATWLLAELPDSGNTYAGTEHTVDVEIDSTGFCDGTYSATDCSRSDVVEWLEIDMDSAGLDAGVTDNGDGTHTLRWNGPSATCTGDLEDVTITDGTSCTLPLALIEHGSNYLILKGGD